MNNKDQYFKQIYEESKDKIYRISLGFMGNKPDADDLFQEILIKIWSNLENFRGESSISTWIYRITSNTALLHLNRRNKSEKRQDQYLPESFIIQNTVGNTFDEAQINELYMAISTLNEMDRIIMGLLLEDNSYAEIADITGMSISNVGVRINRAKKSLTKKMNG